MVSLVVGLAVIVLVFVALGGLVRLAISLLIAMLIGWVAGRLVRGESFGPIGDILLGLAGGVVGNAVLSMLGAGWVDDIWLVGGILSGVIGAVIIVLIIHTLFPRGKTDLDEKLKIRS